MGIYLAPKVINEDAVVNQRQNGMNESQQSGSNGLTLGWLTRKNEQGEGKG